RRTHFRYIALSWAEFLRIRAEPDQYRSVGSFTLASGFRSGRSRNQPQPPHSAALQQGRGRTRGRGVDQQRRKRSIVLNLLCPGSPGGRERAPTGIDIEFHASQIGLGQIN